MQDVKAIILSLFLFGLLTFSNCKKKQITECQGQINYPQKMKDYFLFKLGTYWVYKDSITGELDTVTVSNYSEKNHWPRKELGNRDCPCYQEYTFKVQFSRDKKIEFSQFMYIYKKNPVKLFKSYINNYLDSRKDIEIQRHIVIPPTDTFYFLKDQRIEYKYYDSFKLNKLKFKQSFMKKYLVSNIDWLTYMIYAKNVGLIKYYDKQNRVWELVEYKINQ